jgi:hypothetical protein
MREMTHTHAHTQLCGEEKGRATSLLNTAQYPRNVRVLVMQLRRKEPVTLCCCCSLATMRTRGWQMK